MDPDDSCGKEPVMYCSTMIKIAFPRLRAPSNENVCVDMLLIKSYLDSSSISYVQ